MASLPSLGFTVSNSAEHVTFACKLLTFTEDSYSLQQFLEYGGIDLLIWGSAWSHEVLTALHISLTNIHHRYRQNVLVTILAMRYLGICHHPFWPWKSSWDGCWPGNCIHHLDADGKQTLWVAHAVYNQQLVLSGWRSSGQLSPGSQYWQMVQHQAEMSALPNPAFRWKKAANLKRTFKCEERGESPQESPLHGLRKKINLDVTVFYWITGRSWDSGILARAPVVFGDPTSAAAAASWWYSVFNIKAL